MHNEPIPTNQMSVQLNLSSDAGQAELVSFTTNQKNPASDALQQFGHTRPSQKPTQSRQCNQPRRELAGVADSLNHIQSISRRAETPYQVKLHGQKVNLNRLFKLARWILLNTGAGLERGQIIEGFFQLERLYCGRYVDPCFTPKEKRDHDGKYRKARPLITITLKR